MDMFRVLGKHCWLYELSNMENIRAAANMAYKIKDMALCMGVMVARTWLRGFDRCCLVESVLYSAV